MARPTKRRRGLGATAVDAPHCDAVAAALGRATCASHGDAGTPARDSAACALHGGAAAAIHGLTIEQLQRMRLLGLPVSLLVAVFRWLHKANILGGGPDLDGGEFFAGCCSFSNGCRRAGMTMPGARHGGRGGGGVPSPLWRIPRESPVTQVFLRDQDGWCQLRHLVRRGVPERLGRHPPLQGPTSDFVCEACASHTGHLTHCITRCAAVCRLVACCIGRPCAAAGCG